MPNATVIAHGADLLEAVCSHIPSEAIDMSRTLVVFPGQRPAHFLRKVLARRSRSAFVPPRILSYDDFGEFLAREKLHDTARGLEPIDAAAILFEVHRAIDDRFGGDQLTSFDQFLPVALRLFDELEELHLANQSVPEIRTVIGSLTYGKLHTIAAYYDRFYAEVLARGYRTRASSLRTVAREIDRIELSEFDRVILAGFYALTAVDQVIFRSLARRPDTVLVFQEGKSLVKHLAQIGLAWEGESHTGHAPAPQVRLCSASDTHGQVFALAHDLQEHIAKGLSPDERTVIVLPSAGALLPVLHHALPILKPEEYNISLRYPIARTPAYGFLARLLTVVASAEGGRIALADYVEFLLHPYTKSIRFKTRTDVTRILMHTIEDRLRRKRSGAFMTLEELEGDSLFFQHAVRALASEAPEVTAGELADHLRWIHDNTLRRFWTIGSLDEFARASMDVLLFIHEHSTADSHPLFRPYVEHLVGVLRTCSTSLARTQALEDAAAYQRFLREYVGRTEVPFPGTPLRGIQVLGLLETRNLTFDRVFVLDASDDVIPGSRGEGMFLPQKLREKLGLQTYGDRETLIEYYVDQLRAGAQEVTFFFTEDGKKEKSRFLQKLIWEWEKRDRKPDDGRYVEGVRYAVRLANPKPVPKPKTPDVLDRLKNLEYSASSLDRYLACPLRFYYADVLELGERGTLTSDPDQRDVGSIVHEVLHVLYRQIEDRPLTPGDFTEERLASAVGGVFTEHFGAAVPGKAQLIRRQVELQLRRFLKDYQIPLLGREPVTLLGLERWLTASKNGVVFAGKMDRIERRGDKTAILDYKTGKNSTRLVIKPEKLNPDDAETWPEAVGTVQLPMYWMLYHLAQGEEIDRISPMYIILGGRNFREDVELGIPSYGESPRELYTLLESFLLRVVEHIGDPGTEFTPARNLAGACPGCAFQTVCGTQWLSGRSGA